MKHLNIRISPLLVFGLCVLVYADNLGLFFPFVLASSLHECAHLLSLRLCGVPFCGAYLQLTGTEIEIGNTSSAREAIATAAGPAVNLLLAWFFVRLWPPFCLVNLLLAVYNLLPVYPLDGGRLLRLLLLRLFGLDTGERLHKAFCAVFMLAVAASAAYLTCVQRLGLWPFLLAASLLVRLASNIPCKKRPRPLQ